MLRKLIAILLAILMWVPSVMAGEASEKGSDWQNLSQLRVGQKVVVVSTNMASYKGKFVRFDDTGITLLADKSEHTIAREKVARVSSVSHRVRNGVLLGVAGLVAGGMAAGRACGWTDSCKWDWLMPAGMAGGAAAGAAIPGKTYFRLEKPDAPTK